MKALVIDIRQDKEFWLRVEFMASRWLSSSSEKKFRYHWIDGFEVDSIRKTNLSAEAAGRARVMQGSRCEGLFRFSAKIPSRTLNRSRDDFEIESVVIDSDQETVVIAICGIPEKNRF